MTWRSTLKPCLAVCLVVSTLLTGCEPLPPQEAPLPEPPLGESRRELDGSNITEYAASCRAELGNLKDHFFKCRDGKVIETKNAPDGAKCDKPVWLGLSSDGQCVTNARLLRLAATKADTEVRVICRRYTKGADTSDGFQDVAIVMSNRTTGATCFFQALSGGGRDLDGSKVPNPLADPTSSVLDEKNAAAAAKTFYIAPADLKAATTPGGATLACSQCHDSDPWMHTPYIDQIGDANAVPTDFTDTKYYLVEEAYFTAAPRSWPVPKTVTTAKIKDGEGNPKPQTCTKCHRIGRAQTCDKWVDWSVDASLIPATNAAAQTYPEKMWMPEGAKPAAEADYHKKYDKHVKALKCCCKKPWALGCKGFEDLKNNPGKGTDGDGKKPGSTTVTDKCVSDTGEVALGVSIAPYVVAARSGGDESCNTPFTVPVCANFSIERLLEDGSTTTLTYGPNGNPLRGCGTHPLSPYPGPSDSSINVEAGDLVTISAPQTYAFGASHELLVFSGWNVSPYCPCTGSGPNCQFRTKGASSWFDTDIASNLYAGDPPYFQCQALYTQVGVCKAPDAGVDAGTDAGVDAGFDAGVDAGFDGGTDAGGDAGVCDGGTRNDAGVCTTADAGTDAGTDAGSDAGADAGRDAGADAGRDAGADAGTCGPLPCDTADASVLICDGGMTTTVMEDGRIIQACHATDTPLPIPFP